MTPQFSKRPSKQLPHRTKHLLQLLTLLGLGISLFLIDLSTPKELLLPHHTAHQSTTINSNLKDAQNEGTCIPPLPQHIIHTPFSSLPPPLQAQFHAAKARLTAKLAAYAATSNDTLSISVVHGDSEGGEELFWWGTGDVKLNSTTADSHNQKVSRDSIFRIASITKVFTVLEGLILQTRSRPRPSGINPGDKGNGDQKKPKPRLTMEDDVRLHLPGFTLPEPFTEEGITLNMLGGHTSGLPKDVSVFGVDFDQGGYGGKRGTLEYMPGTGKVGSESVMARKQFLQGGAWGGQSILKANRAGYMGGVERDGTARISAPGKCRLMRKGKGDADGEWHQCTKEELFELVKGTRLIWLPGEMVSYSNTGFDVLGWALQNFAASFDNTAETESYHLRHLLHRDVFQPLGMNSTFFHPIPPHLRSRMTVPRSEHMVDLDFGEAYDPAGGMYSTPTDLTTFLRSLLSPFTPLLPPPTLRTWLKPTFPLQNGLSSVGTPWEIEARQYPDSQGPVYQLYGKGGALPGHYSHISLVPELGYGVVALVAIGSEEKDIKAGVVKESNPDYLSNIVHDELVAPLREAYSAYLKENYMGRYTQYPPSPPHATNPPGIGEAVISFLPEPNGILVLDSLVTALNISLLHYLDSLNPGNLGAYADGGKLWPSGIEGEFRVRGGSSLQTKPGKRSCREWFSFDEATTEQGWGVDKIIIRRYQETGTGAEGSDWEEGTIACGGSVGCSNQNEDGSSGGWELVYEPLEVVFRKRDV